MGSEVSIRDRHNLIANAQDALDNTDVARACDEVRSFCDVLTNWYVRRSRERFWNESPEARCTWCWKP